MDRYRIVSGVSCISPVCFACVCLAVVPVTPSPSYAAPVLRTFAQTVAGQSAFGTYAIPSPIFEFFGANGVSNPVPGLPGSGVASDTHTSTAASGVLTDSAALSHAFGPVGFQNTFAGSSNTHARYGKVGAQAHASFTGATDGNTLKGAQAFGMFTETFTATSPSVTNGAFGKVVFEFTIDGSLTTSNANPYVTTSDFEFGYKINSGATWTLFRGQANYSTINPFLSALNGVSGYTLGPGTASGSGAFYTHAIDFIYGTPFDFSFATLAYVIPGPGGTGDVDFAASAVLTGINLYNGGIPVTNFNIAAGSGTFYDANGVHLPITGDLNGDGFVGIADLNIVLGAWNQTVPPGNPLADPSDDGFVGIADLNIVLGNWNAGTPPALTANIPEPGTLTVGLVCVLAGLRRRA